MYGSNLFLSPSRSALLKGARFDGGVTNEPNSAKSILEAFDVELQKNYSKKVTIWLGTTPLKRIPSITNFVQKNRRDKKTLLEDLLYLREKPACKNYRQAVGQLNRHVTAGESKTVMEIVNAIERYTYELCDGEVNDPSKINHAISLTIPFIGGLGIDTNIARPKIQKNVQDKIITFLHETL